jgi:hypothetical protein
MQTYLWVQPVDKNSGTLSLDLERVASFEELAAKPVSSPFVEHTRQLYKHAHQVIHTSVHHVVTQQESALPS